MRSQTTTGLLQPAYTLIISTLAPQGRAVTNVVTPQSRPLTWPATHQVTHDK